jgi:two-component system sensor histidine kinase ChvG
MNAPAGRVAARTGRVPRLRAPMPRFRVWQSLSAKILAVNIFALMVLAGGILYLDSYRARLIEARQAELVAQAETIAHFLGGGAPGGLEATYTLSGARGMRVRVYGEDGALVVDNWRNPGVARFDGADPARDGWRRRSAVAIDRVIALLTGASLPPPLEAPAVDRRDSWPEAVDALSTGQPAVRARATPDGVWVLQAAVPVRDGMGTARKVVMLSADTADVTETVRRERETSFTIFLFALATGLLLSVFLARTIVQPLRQLARATHRVRLGRARDVVMPRLPRRHDEIGRLARALAEMTTTLRHRIDATESFAADVAHELKNPLASLRSAVEALGSVSNPDARAQLFDLIHADVRRIDRLVSDISAASRIDAELSRARLQPVDLSGLLGDMLRSIDTAGQLPRGIRLALDAASDAGAVVAADPDRLGQVFRNLLDNALSFSPEGGTVSVSVERRGDEVVVTFCDEGPGVPAVARDMIFERFYSERPDAESYGQHSGLGLSIARAIVEALDGHIEADDRPDGAAGACFRVVLPAY